MFSENLIDELQDRIGTRVQVTTDNNVFEGVLGLVSGEIIRIVLSSGYGEGTTTNVSLNAVNFIRFLSAAA
ncbi:hypothetical protein [Metabacillus malikii]|uniref:DUF2642 domain-containing protein n=1 Tax=Metabacillus malikii TaxID=1504265 RepID=A0ABT9ZLW0_9BACI|nr:hypothetical protein [Metabacillus malikii]MDQ0232503.1 hypothetical protein [Metabacillus malikii]